MLCYHFVRHCVVFVVLSGRDKALFIVLMLFV